MPAPAPALAVLSARREPASRRPAHTSVGPRPSLLTCHSLSRGDAELQTPDTSSAGPPASRPASGSRQRSDLSSPRPSADTRGQTEMSISCLCLRAELLLGSLTLPHHINYFSEATGNVRLIVKGLPSYQVQVQTRSVPVCYGDTAPARCPGLATRFPEAQPQSKQPTHVSGVVDSSLASHCPAGPPPDPTFHSSPWSVPPTGRKFSPPHQKHSSTPLSSHLLEHPWFWAKIKQNQACRALTWPRHLPAVTASALALPCWFPVITLLPYQNDICCQE